MVVVHTTVWVDYFNGVGNPETDWLDAELDRQRLAVTDIILCKVLQGIRDDTSGSRLRSLRTISQPLSDSSAIVGVGVARLGREPSRSGLEVHDHVATPEVGRQ